MASVTRPPRALRGLLLGFALSFLNLLGTVLALEAIGGLGAWTGRQFIGLFGLLEMATGVAFIFGPNIWRLPVAEAHTSDRTAVRLAASTVFIPHWAAAAKALAGAVMLAVAAQEAGIGPATAGVPLLVAFVVLGAIGLSLVAARVGVARPDLDVVEIVVKRPGHRDVALPGVSIGGIVVQLLLNIGAFPAVKALPPSVLYHPEVGPSTAVLAVGTTVTAVLLLAAYAAWHGRISWRAPREQQREAEQFS